MGEVNEINVKNQTYYSFDDMIDIKNFHSNLLKIDKKSHKDVDIYYPGYVTKFSDYENVNNVTPLHLIIHSATGSNYWHFKDIGYKFQPYFICLSSF